MLTNSKSLKVEFFSFYVVQGRPTDIGIYRGPLRLLVSATLSYLAIKRPGRALLIFTHPSIVEPP